MYLILIKKLKKKKKRRDESKDNFCIDHIQIESSFGIDTPSTEVTILSLLLVLLLLPMLLTLLKKRVSIQQHLLTVMLFPYP